MKGPELQYIRRLLGFSRPQLALLINVHPDTIRYWERKVHIRYDASVPEQILAALDLGALDVQMAQWSDRYRRLLQNSKCPVAPKGYEDRVSNEPEGQSPEIQTGKTACGARTRTGGACKAKPFRGRSRCRMHGGLSTGPKTEAGRQRISDAQKRRWKNAR